MIKEAMEFLRGLADAARKPTVLHLAGDPPDVSLLCRPDGTEQRMTALPGERTVHLYRLDELVELANNHFDQAVAANQRMAIFHDDHQVELIFDTRDGRERARVRLIESDEFAFFVARLKEPLIGVSDFRRALRYVLPQTQDPTDIELLEQQIGQLGTESGTRAEQTSRRDRESMGLAITQAIADKRDMPKEGQTFNIRPFHNPDLEARFAVDCILDPEPTSGKWLLWPVRSSWWQLQGDVTLYIARQLTGTLVKGIPVYAGSFTVAPGAGGWS